MGSSDGVFPYKAEVESSKSLTKITLLSSNPSWPEFQSISCPAVTHPEALNTTEVTTSGIRKS